MDSISPHQDNEVGLDVHAPIASLSFGATRLFEFTPVDGAQQAPIGKVGIKLIGGSYLVMRYPTNIFWKHAIPKQPGIREPRLNITFRVLK